jgi:hypothetical protein
MEKVKQPLKTSIFGWSPNCWKWLHSPSTVLTPELIKIVAQILPCNICRHHMMEYVVEHPPCNNLQEWVSDLHNDVNRRTGRGPILVYGNHLDTVVHDPQEFFVDYLIAVAYVMGTDHIDFVNLCWFGMKSVNLVPPPSSIIRNRCALFRYMSMRGYLGTRTQEDLLEEFVPDNAQTFFACDESFPVFVSLPPPCESMYTNVKFISIFCTLLLTWSFLIFVTVYRAKRKFKK